MSRLTKFERNPATTDRSLSLMSLITMQGDRYMTALNDFIDWGSSNPTFCAAHSAFHTHPCLDMSTQESIGSPTIGFPTLFLERSQCLPTMALEANFAPASSLSPEPQLENVERRRAQNRNAQRAYRARKEQQIRESYERILELEQKLKRTKRDHEQTDQYLRLLQRNEILESENKSLHEQIEQIRQELRSVLEVPTMMGQ